MKIAMASVNRLASDRPARLIARALIDRCRVEGRVLFTTDLHFADIRAYPPSDQVGIVVIRAPKPSRAALQFTAAASVLTAITVIGCSASALTVLPENPCDLLSVQQVAAAAGVKISGAQRALSQQESIDAGSSRQQPASGSICRYESPTPLASIAVIFPERRGPLHRRSDAPRCSGGDATGISEDPRIWHAGGARAVCVGPDLVVWVSVQMAHASNAVPAAMGVARAIVQRLPE